MSIKVTFPKADAKITGAVIVGVFDDKTLSPQAEKQDKPLKVCSQTL